MQHQKQACDQSCMKMKTRSQLYVADRWLPMQHTVVTLLCFLLAPLANLNNNQTTNAQLFYTTNDNNINFQMPNDQQATPFVPYKQNGNNYQFEINENAPNNTFIGKVTSIVAPAPYLVTPTLETSDLVREKAFYVSPSGEIRTNGPLDREQVGQYVFVLISINAIELTCTVIIKDVNDNKPHFMLPDNETFFKIEIPEETPHARKALPPAIDYDIEQNGIKEFRITEGNVGGAFKLVLSGSPLSMVAGDDEENDIHIKSIDSQASLVVNQDNHTHKQYVSLEVLNHKILDRENKSTFNLEIEVSDNGSPQLSSRIFVIVKLLDINDNPPIFSQKQYEVHHREDLPVSSLVTRVQAHDPDLEEKGQVSFSIKRHTTSTGQVWNCNSTTTTSTITPQPSFLQNSLNNNINDNKISSNKYQMRNSLSQSSNSNNDPTPYFSIAPLKGEIYLEKPFDYEKDQWHELIIEARDQGKPARYSEAVIKIYVTDVEEPVDQPIASQPSIMNIQADERNKQGTNDLNRLMKNDILVDPSKLQMDTSLAMQVLTHPSNFLHWFSQLNASYIFVFILLAFVIVAFPVCLVKAKSKQPKTSFDEGDVNVNVNGYTLSSNNNGVSSIQPKLSPHNSIITVGNEHSLDTNGRDQLRNHHFHHNHHHHHLNNMFDGSANHASALFARSDARLSHFASLSTRSAHHYNSSSNLYYNMTKLGSTLSHRQDSVGGNSPQDRCEHQVAPLMHAQDLYGSYNWDYLNDWSPEFKSITQMLPVNF